MRTKRRNYLCKFSFLNVTVPDHSLLVAKEKLKTKARNAGSDAGEVSKYKHSTIEEFEVAFNCKRLETKKISETDTKNYHINKNYCNTALIFLVSINLVTDNKLVSRFRFCR